jgi:site-specific DNA-cytosine methylase
MAAREVRGSAGAGDREGRGWADRSDLAATLNSGGNDGGFRTEPGEHLVAVSVTENQRGEVSVGDTTFSLAGGGGKPGQGYSATLGTFGTSGMSDDPLLPLGLDSHRYRCCGNGVVAPVAEWLGQRLAEALA